MFVFGIYSPPGTVVPGGLMFNCWCVFFSARDLWCQSADRRETLPRDRKLLPIYNLGPINRRPSAQKSGAKKCKIWRHFGQLQTSIANSSGTEEDIEDRKKQTINNNSAHVRRKQCGELGCTDEKV